MLPLPYAARLHFVFKKLDMLLGMRLYYVLGREQPDPLASDRRLAVFLDSGAGAEPKSNCAVV